MTMEQLTALNGRTPTMADVTSSFAVVIPVIQGADGLSILFEVRAATMRRQPNEICFPGGRLEVGERPQEGAFRELEEELGIPQSALTLLAPMNFLGHQSGFLLHPFLVEVDGAALPQAKPNPDEVGELFTVPLDFFLNTEPELYSYKLLPQTENFPYDRVGVPATYTWSGGRANIPVYRWEERIIWGLTGRIIRDMVSTLKKECSPWV